MHPFSTGDVRATTGAFSNAEWQAASVHFHCITIPQLSNYTFNV